jgi:hypothetical protein
MIGQQNNQAINKYLEDKKEELPQTFSAKKARSVHGLTLL